MKPVGRKAEAIEARDFVDVSWERLSDLADADVFFVIDGDTTKERLESDPRWATFRPSKTAWSSTVAIRDMTRL